MVCEPSGTKTTWALSSSEKYKWILFSIGQSRVKYKSRQTGEEAQRQHGGHNTRHGHRWLPPVCCWNTSMVSPSSISSPWGVSFSDIGCPSNLNLTVVCTSFWNIMMVLKKAWYNAKLHFKMLLHSTINLSFEVHIFSVNFVNHCHKPKFYTKHRFITYCTIYTQECTVQQA